MIVKGAGNIATHPFVMKIQGKMTANVMLVL